MRKEPLCGELRWNLGVWDRENGEVSAVDLQARCAVRENEMVRRTGEKWK